MATRGTIALEFADGTIGQIYSHWDNYIEHNGKILFEYYQDPFKVRELIDNGYVSILAEEIGGQHPFDNPARYGTPEFEEFRDKYGKMCTFYARDRGETGVGANYFKDFADYEKNHQYEQYEYILRKDGNWYVCYDEEYVLLSQELATSKK